MTQPTLINLHPNEYSQELHYYPFAVKSDRCDLILKNFSGILTKDISCKCKYKFGNRKCNSNQKWNNNKCWLKAWFMWKRLYFESCYM